MKTKIFLFGAGIHAHTCIDLIEKNDEYDIIGIIDSVKKVGSVVESYPIIGNIDNLAELAVKFGINKGFISIGTNWIRMKVFKDIQIKVSNFEFINLIHPTAVFGKNIVLGKGILIGALAYISSNCEIGDFCLIHQKAHLGLFNKMEYYSSISLGSLTGGKVKIGFCSAITLRVIVNDRINIGSNTVIGSGSLVLKDVPNNSVAYGQPATVVRYREQNDPYLKSS